MKKKKLFSFFVMPTVLLLFCVYTVSAAVPSITSQPASQFIDAGSNVEFMVNATDATSYAWYKCEDPNIDKSGNTWVSVGTDSNSLSVSNVQEANEGFYFCQVSNAEGDANSSVATLMTKRLVSHWQFELDYLDTMNYADGYYDGAGGEPSFTTNTIIGTYGLFCKQSEADYLTVDYTPKLNLEKFSFSVWARVTHADDSKYRAVFSTVSNDPHYSGCVLYAKPDGTFENGRWSFWTGDSAGFNNKLDGPPIEYDQWCNIVGTVEDGIQKLYIDGLLYSEMEISTFLPNTVEELYFSRAYNYGAANYYFQGAIDDARYYSYALSDGEVFDNYAAVITGPLFRTHPENQLVYAGSNAVFTVDTYRATGTEWYKVNPSGSDILVATDTNTLTITNVQESDEGDYYCVGYNSSTTPTSRASETANLMTKRLVARWDFEDNLVDEVEGWTLNQASGSPAYVSSTYGCTTSKAVSFSGDLNERLVLSYTPELNTEAFTVLALAKPSGSGYRGLISTYYQVSSSKQYGYVIYASPDNLWTGWFGQGDGVFNTVDGPIFTPDEWGLVAITCDSNGLQRVYVNGELVASDTDDYAPNPTGEFCIGGSHNYPLPYAFPFDGLVDEVRYYSYPLTPDEIAQQYADWFCEPVCMQQSQYDLDDDCAVTMSDLDILAGTWLDDSMIYPTGN